MTAPRTRVVYDCAVFLQGLGRPNSVARTCLDLAVAGAVELCGSPETIRELDEVLARPEVVRKFPRVESMRSQDLLSAIKRAAISFEKVPKAFHLTRDSDDEPYTDLAIAAEASYLVTWNDRHLTYLMRRDTPEGTEFCDRFPGLRIVPPPDFVRAVGPTP